MQNNDSNSGTIKGKKMQQLQSTFICICVLEKFRYFEDFKIGMVKLIRLRGRSF